MSKDLSEKFLNHKSTISLEDVNYSGKKRLDLNDLLRRNKDIKKHDTIRNLIIFSAVTVIFSIIALTYIFIKF
jgi:hypothetical protein